MTSYRSIILFALACLMLLVVARGDARTTTAPAVTIASELAPLSRFVGGSG